MISKEHELPTLVEKSTLFDKQVSNFTKTSINNFQIGTLSGSNNSISFGDGHTCNPAHGQTTSSKNTPITEPLYYINRDINRYSPYAPTNRRGFKNMEKVAFFTLDHILETQGLRADPKENEPFE